MLQRACQCEADVRPQAAEQDWPVSSNGTVGYIPLAELRDQHRSDSGCDGGLADGRRTPGPHPDQNALAKGFIPVG